MTSPRTARCAASRSAPPVASRAYVDNARLHEELLAYRETRSPSRALLRMIQEICLGLSRNSRFRGYDTLDLEDMRASAMFEFLRYGHNYNPSRCRSANGAFTFITWNAENAFKRFLRGHYRQVNVKAAHDAPEDLLIDWCEAYTARMLDDGSEAQQSFLDAL